MKLTDKIQLVSATVKSASAFYHLQVNIFLELVEELLEVGRLSINNP